MKFIIKYIMLIRILSLIHFVIISILVCTIFALTGGYIAHLDNKNTKIQKY